jgi:uncharacterized protein YbcI
LGVLTWTEEFSGTLLGFDDYVSKYPFSIRSSVCYNMLIIALDMVLEDVTEL